MSEEVVQSVDTKGQSAPVTADVSEQGSAEDFSAIAESVLPGLFPAREPEVKQTSDKAPKSKEELASDSETPDGEPKEKELSEKDARKLWHNKLAEMNAREAKFKERREDLKNKIAIVTAAEKALSSDMTILTRGDGAQVLEALARITKRDAATLYEQMGHAMLGRKKDPSAQRVEELEATVQELKAKLETDHEVQNRAGTVQRVKTEIKTLMSDGDQWPIIAAYAAKDGADTAGFIEERYSEMCQEAGGWLDTDVVLDRIERGLRKATKGHAGTDKPAAGSGPGRASETRDESRSQATAQRPPTSIPTSTASQGSTLRELSDPERDRDVVENYHGLWAELGL